LWPEAKSGSARNWMMRRPQMMTLSTKIHSAKLVTNARLNHHIHFIVRGADLRKPL
jgi:hypothetical protein